MSPINDLLHCKSNPAVTGSDSFERFLFARAARSDADASRSMPGALDDDVSVHALTFPFEALPIESLRATPFDLQKNAVLYGRRNERVSRAACSFRRA